MALADNENAAVYVVEAERERERGGFWLLGCHIIRPLSAETITHIIAVPHETVGVFLYS